MAPTASAACALSFALSQLTGWVPAESLGSCCARAAAQKESYDDDSGRVGTIHKSQLRPKCLAKQGRRLSFGSEGIMAN